MFIKKYLKGNKVAINTGWMVSTQIYQMVISLVVGIITTRYLGPTNLGVINYTLAYVSFCVPICGLGLEGVLVKKYVENPQKAGSYIGTSIAMQGLCAMACTVIIVTIINLTNCGDRVKTVVAILQSIYLIAKSAEAIEFWYQSKLKSKYTAIIKAGAYTIVSLYKVIILLMDKTVEWFAFATSLDMIVIAMLYLFLYAKHDGPKLIIDFGIAKELLKESYHFILSGIMVMLYAQMDKIMLQGMLGDTYVGLYSASNTICKLWFFVPSAIIVSVRPLIMQAKNISECLYLKRLKQLYAVVFWLGAFVAILFTLLSKHLIYILYGSAYIEASVSLAIGVWSGMFAQLGTARSIWILCEKKNQYTKLYLIWGATVNLLLNYILIPYCGINGAAIATLCTEIVVCIISPLFYKETRVHTKLVLHAIVCKFDK